MTTSDQHDEKDKNPGEFSTSEDWLNFQKQINSLAHVLERINLSEYITYLNNPRRMLLLNFVNGLVRGLGIALGATILAGIVLIFLKKLVFLNLPVIGGFIAELVKIVNAHNGY